MAKLFAWLLFFFMSALFIVSLAHQQTMRDYDEFCSKMEQPLPDMVRFQHACAAGADDEQD
jgi:hypothetical protein